MLRWEDLALLTVPTLILLAGVGEDLRTKKVRNRTVLICAGVALATVLLTSGAAALLWALASGFAAFTVCLPLVLLGILGAGDMKLFVAFSFATQWTSVLTVFVAALVWGAVFGLLQSLIGGQGKNLFHNIFAIVTRRERIPTASLHTVPYTVALLFGWITFLTIDKFGGHYL